MAGSGLLPTKVALFIGRRRIKIQRSGLRKREKFGHPEPHVVEPPLGALPLDLPRIQKDQNSGFTKREKFDYPEP